MEAGDGGTCCCSAVRAYSHDAVAAGAPAAASSSCPRPPVSRAGAPLSGAPRTSGGASLEVAAGGWLLPFAAGTNECSGAICRLWTDFAASAGTGRAPVSSPQASVFPASVALVLLRPLPGSLLPCVACPLTCVDRCMEQTL